MKVKSLKKKLGQGTAEYLILLVLLSVGSIGIFTVFGGTLRTQLNNVVAAFTGADTNIVEETTLQGASTEAKKRADAGVGMGGINKDEVKKYSVK